MPKTDAGAMAWDVLMRCAGQVRLGGMGGVAGIDMNAALEIARVMGFDLRAIAELLPYGEAGLVTAMNRKEKGGD